MTIFASKGLVIGGALSLCHSFYQRNLYTGTLGILSLTGAWFLSEGQNAIKNLSDNIQKLERDVLQAHIIGEFPQKKKHFISAYNKYCEIIEKLPLEKYESEAALMCEIGDLIISDPKTLNSHLNTLGIEVIRLSKPVKELERSYRILCESARLLQERSLLLEQDREMLQSIYNLLKNPNALTRLPSSNVASSSSATTTPYGQLRCGAEEIQIMRELMIPLGTVNFWGLVTNSIFFYGLGKKLTARNLHSLKFLEVIFTDPELTRCMRNVYEDSLKSFRFIAEFKEKVNARIANGENFDILLPEFAQRLNVRIEEIQPFFQSCDWDGLLKYLIYNR